MNTLPSSFVIKGAQVILCDSESICDVQVRDGRIYKIGVVTDASVPVLDAKGLTLFPGVIDPQVHFREPGFEYKETIFSGSRACAAGGVTSFFEMPNTKPATTTEALMQWKKNKAAESSLVNYNFFIGATRDNLDVLNSVRNVAGIKIFMGSSTGDLLVDDPNDLENIFAHTQRLIAVHAEDELILKAQKSKIVQGRDFSQHPHIRPAEAAWKATRQACALAQKYNHPLHILHLTTAEEVQLLSELASPLITAETTPQHLFFEAPDVYERLGSRAQMNPPIREKNHREALRRAVKSGIIQMIATDHAPHTLEEKSKNYPDAPSGMPGVETSLPVMLTLQKSLGLSLGEIAELMSTNAARRYRVVDRGEIREGAYADLVLVDLKAPKTIEKTSIRSKVGWNPFEGIELVGWPVMTFVNGSCVFREGEIIESRGAMEVIFLDTAQSSDAAV